MGADDVVGEEGYEVGVGYQSGLGLLGGFYGHGWGMQGCQCYVMSCHVCALLREWKGGSFFFFNFCPPWALSVGVVGLGQGDWDCSGSDVYSQQFG